MTVLTFKKLADTCKLLEEENKKLGKTMAIHKQLSEKYDLLKNKLVTTQSRVQVVFVLSQEDTAECR